MEFYFPNKKFKKSVSISYFGGIIELYLQKFRNFLLWED